MADELLDDDEFPDYDELVPPLKLKIRGIAYVLPPVSARNGVLLALAGEDEPGAKAKLAKMTNDAFMRIFLGDQLEKMHANGAPGAAIQRAYVTALADHRFGRKSALATWKAGESPEFRAALAAAAELAAKDSSSKTSTSTESAPKTPSPASTAPTTSPKTTPRSTSRAKRSPGSTSSKTGPA